MMDRDWDSLILLDACRYDVFSKINVLTGTLTTYRSNASATGDFVRRNWLDQEFHDTVMVTGNPHAEMLSDEFHHIEIAYGDHWNKDVGTVYPAPIEFLALQARNDYPDKRLIVHFMQPHEPHIGETAERIRERLNLRGWDKYHEVEGMSSDLDGMRIWDAVKSGFVDINEVRQAYRDSLRIVMFHVDRLIKEFAGKTVVSADHGELLGEVYEGERQYGHPKHLDVPELRRVPWFEAPHEARLTITEGEPGEFEGLGSVKDRLRDLGYLR